MAELNLVFDTMEVNTELARDYLKSINEFHPVSTEGLVEPKAYCFVSLDFPIKIRVSERNSINPSIHFPGHWNDEKLFDLLADKIEENTALFAQLEYALRRIPFDDTKSQIKLITQHFRYRRHHPLVLPNTEENWQYIYLDDRAPLFTLGCLAERRQAVLMVSTNVAAVAHLFVQLCREVGLIIYLYFVNTALTETNTADGIFTTSKKVNGGCVGVIAEQADLESAIDVFIESSTLAPWRIRRILVQESVYEQFREVLVYKSKGSLEGNALQVKDKRFSFDFTEQDSDIHVEAYRTSKELLALLKKGPFDPHYLSVWSSVTAVAMEVADATDAPVVWINDLGTFNGPPQSANAVYSHIYRENSDLPPANSSKDLAKIKQNWLKLNTEKRIRVVHEVMEKYNSTDRLAEAVMSDDLRTDDVAHIGNGSLTIVQHSPPKGWVYVDDDLDTSSYVHLFKSVVLGTAIVLKGERYEELCEALLAAGVPIQYVVRDGTEEPLPLYLAKAIYTNFGTIFAN